MGTDQLPADAEDVCGRFVTTEFTTIDRRGQPIVWPVNPYFDPAGPVISATTGLGYPKKANDARARPRVGMLFSDPSGSGLVNPPTVFVQGIAEVDDLDLDANRERYAHESAEKLPGIHKLMPPRLGRFLNFYFTRIYIHVRPTNIYVWRGGLATPPELLTFDTEVPTHRPPEDQPDRPPRETAPIWDERILEIGGLYPTVVLSIVAGDGFPLSCRLPASADSVTRRIRIDAAGLTLPLRAGLACLTGHDHEPTMAWQRNFQVRGDLVEDEAGWALLPRRLVGGFEGPPSNPISKTLTNGRKVLRFRRTAREELRRRARRLR